MKKFAYLFPDVTDLLFCLLIATCLIMGNIILMSLTSGTILYTFLYEGYCFNYPLWLLALIQCIVDINMWVYEWFIPFFGTKTPLLIGIFLAPILEELEFRGIIYKYQNANKYIKYGLVFLSTLLFGLAHHVPIAFTITIMTMALLSCHLIFKTKKLYFSIFLHALYNSIVFALCVQFIS